ncbi:DNA-binding protein [Streptomyces griseoflavus]|nr:DNA-binding protein [Streptomyces griseoflavus]
MPPRSSPTARQQRLGAELRKLREASGMPAREAGALLGGNQAQISHLESGRLGISAERVRRLAVFYSASDSALIDALCNIAEDRHKGWWDEYRGILPRGFLDIAEMEHHASFLLSLQTLTVPGILQTPDYARAIFGGALPPLPESELEARVEHRMKRRAILERDTPTPFEAVIHEAALRMRYGGQATARAQLEYLLEATELPSVTVRVIPFSTEKFIGWGQSVLYAGGPVPQLDTVQLDSAYGPAFLDAGAQLSSYRAVFEATRHASLSASESKEHIHSIAKEM